MTLNKTSMEDDMSGEVELEKEVTDLLNARRAFLSGMAVRLPRATGNRSAVILAWSDSMVESGLDGKPVGMMFVAEFDGLAAAVYSLGSALTGSVGPNTVPAGVTIDLNHPANCGLLAQMALLLGGEAAFKFAARNTQVERWPGSFNNLCARALLDLSKDERREE